MSTPEDLRKIQLLERRLRNPDPIKSSGGNSRGKGGSNSNSIDFFQAQAILSAVGNSGGGNGSGDLSASHATVKDLHASSNSNSRGSVENKQNEVRHSNAARNSSSSSSSSIANINNKNSNHDNSSNDNGKGKAGKNGQLLLNAANLAAAMEVAGESHTELMPMQMPFHSQDSNHSISRISPLRAPAVDKTRKTRKGIGKAVGGEAPGGSSSAGQSDCNGNKRKGAPRDINSVLKHVDAEEEEADAGAVPLSLNLGDEPSPKSARLSLGAAAGAAGVGAGAGAGTEASQDSSSFSLDIAGSEKDGSRGAAGGRRMNNIQNYFAPQSGGNGQDLTNFFSSAAGDAQAGGAAAASSDSGGNNGTASSAAASTLDDASAVESAPAPVASSSSSSGNGSASSKRGRGSKAGAADMAPPSIAPSSSLLDKGVMKQVEILKMSKEQAENKIHRMETELSQAAGRQKVLEDRNIKVIKKLEEVQREMAKQEARRRRDRLALDCVRLGKVSTVRTSATSFGDGWEEGYALKELNVRAGVLAERREELNRRRNDLTSLKRKSKAKKEREHKEGSTAAAAAVGITGLDDDSSELDFVSESEAILSHLNQLKKDENALSEERRLLETEKAAHQKELKRCSSEDKSRFYKAMPCLHDRYLLVSMLGRGGFSEVWKALDLMELREVAIKIHQLNPTWNEDRKNTYIRHVTREYTIHRDMQHPRVVQLFDVFEIDNNSFATVLELCRGIDLDEKLKRNRLLPEKDARTILLQIVSGLRYLNVPSVSDDSNDNNNSNSRGQIAHTQGGKRMAIIHYDLKPANILFDEMGDAKITDFGLSKIIDDTNDDESLELTSQGAGTYWYLPPECFAKGDENGGPRVSSKVDVWSVGVIFYQMLFGKRPFGEGKSQELVLREGVILNAHQVDFPPADKGPKVSNEAKDLIRACLTHNKEHRPDVHALCMHTYLSGKTKVY